jgi:hypothetical protein
MSLSGSAMDHPNRVGITAPSGDTSNRLATTEFVSTGFIPQSGLPHPNFLWADLGGGSSNNQSVPGGAITIIALARAVVDADATLKSSNNAYQPNIPGNYLICGAARVSAISSAAFIADCAVGIAKNGIPIFFGSDVVSQSNALGSAAEGMSSYISAIVQMNGTTDFIQFVIFYSAGSSGTSSGSVQGNNSLTWFTASRML